MEERKPLQGSAPTSAPGWLAGGRLDEVGFCQAFLADYPMLCCRGSFFTIRGCIDDEDMLRSAIYLRLRPWLRRGLSGAVEALLGVLRNECRTEELAPAVDRVHVANGNVHADGSFSEYMDFCRNRLPVAYRPDAPKPECWLRFVHELLEPEDVLTLQEYMGYCLLSTNLGQRMLLIIGRGGEGKSRIGRVLRELFGSSMVNGSIAKLELNRFARADLENKLVMVDDDIRLEALPQTNYIKSIVTADTPLDLERKGRQSYQSQLYCRLICFGNGSLKALYDHSEGFYRRQIILRARPKPPEREDDPFLGVTLCREKEGILLWCIEGMKRLVGNGLHFTLSSRARENAAEAQRAGNNLTAFLRSEGYLDFRPDGVISSRRLYEIYELWCEDNAERPQGRRSVSSYLNENLDLYDLRATTNVDIGLGRRARGYQGVAADRRVGVGSG